MNVTGVSLAAGSWQIYVQTNGGLRRASPFMVGPPGPTITGYKWTSPPVPQPTLQWKHHGNWVRRSLYVWFCPLSGSCQQLPGAQVTLNDHDQLEP